MAHQRAIRNEPARQGRAGPTYVIAVVLMVINAALAIAYCAHFTLTASQATGVIVCGFLCPIGFVLAMLTVGRGPTRRSVAGLLLVLSFFGSVLVLVGLLVFGATTLGS